MTQISTATPARQARGHIERARLVAGGDDTFCTAESSVMDFLK